MARHLIQNYAAKAVHYNLAIGLEAISITLVCLDVEKCFLNMSYQCHRFLSKPTQNVEQQGIQRWSHM